MIGYYVHHHGHGHRTRATEIARHLAAMNHEVIGFGSMPTPTGWSGEWVQLSMDTNDDDGHPATPRDPTAAGVFHWAPINIRGHRERMAALAERLGRDITAMVVDTSAEVTLLSRLMGVPTAVIAMRGDRRDRTHEAAYDAADLLIAPWPEASLEPTWPGRWLAKTQHVDAISRFDERARLPKNDSDQSERTVLVLWGAGGTSVSATDIDAAQAATPGWTWLVRSAETLPSPNLWDELCTADVAVTHGGQNSVAEVAAAGRPAIVIAQDRPFDEQLSTVAALREVGACVALDRWPAPSEWPTLLDRAAQSHNWDTWTTRHGAERAARVLAEWEATHGRSASR